MNIKFNYLYRDAGNYKTYGFVIFSNPNNYSIEATEGKLKELLIDSQFFNPADFNVPFLAQEDFKYDSELDHSWNEFDSLELTKDDATDKRTIIQFLEQSIKDHV